MEKHQASTYNGLFNPWNWWLKKAANFKPEVLAVIGGFLFLWVGIGAYITGRLPLAPPQQDMPSTNSGEHNKPPSQQDSFSSTNAIEHNKLAIPFIWGLGSLFVIPYLAAIDARIKESEKQRSIVSITVPKPDLEYLSSMTHSFKQLPDRLNTFSKGVTDLLLQGDTEFKQTLDSTFKEFTARQEAVGGLHEGLRCDEKDPTSIVAMIRAACDEALTDNYSHDEIVRFRKCMYAYVRAWLICSIQYGTFLPIDSIFYQDSGRKDEYLIAVKNLRRRLRSEPIDKFLRTRGALEIVDRYMDELAKLIEQASPVINQSASLDSKVSDSSS